MRAGQSGQILVVTPVLRRPARAQQQPADFPIVVVEQPRRSGAARAQLAYQPQLSRAQPVGRLAAGEQKNVAYPQLSLQQRPGPAGGGQHIHRLAESRMQVANGHREHHHVAQGAEAHH